MRFKILITLLLVVTIVVGLITFTMARMFHMDKTAYIHDMTSVIALHTAQESRALLVGYGDRLKVFTRIMFESGMSTAQKTKLLKEYFEDFREFVAITMHRDGRDPVTVYDTRLLQVMGVSKDDLRKYRKENPLPMKRIMDGEVFVENSTLVEKFPTMTMTLRQTPPGANRSVVVEATIRLNSLLGLAGRSRVFETFIVDSRGIVLAHSDPVMVGNRTPVDWIPQMESLQKQQSLSTTSEYIVNGVEMVGGFSRMEFSGLLAGVQIPKTAAYLTARELLHNLIYMSLALLIMAALVGIFGARGITRSLVKLSEATKVVAKGTFGVKVEGFSHDEIGDLAGSFNKMSSELELREEKLKEAQTALIQSEKMAAFGQLGAGIAHEVKNPLAGILGFAQLSLRKVESDSPLYKNLTTIEKETKRCKTIIENLLKFARQEKVAFEPTDMNRVVEDAVVIVDHQLGIHHVNVKMELAASLPKILGNGNQIQQVFMNLMINAQQAMEGKPGNITISTKSPEPDTVEVRVTDDGPGMPGDVKARIFEPFYTTKPAGQGTGLGLSVSYGIVREHNGDITLESEKGKGTTFVLTFPVAGSSDQDAGTEIGAE